jgi:hypothetical protein
MSVWIDARAGQNVLATGSYSNFAQLAQEEAALREQLAAYAPRGGYLKRQALQKSNEADAAHQQLVERHTKVLAAMFGGS